MTEYTALIIDDDVWMQRILSKTLQSYGFKKTFLASNGFDGIASAIENDPALIIMDILMPELSGHLSLKILKRIKLTRDIPVIMVSALSDTENLGLSVKSGAAGFISKPFTRATVYEKLVQVFGADKLDKIIKGEDPDDIYGEDTLPDFDEEPPAIRAEEGETPTESKEKEKSSEKLDEKKKDINRDRLMKRYRDDEKKSIESIKKLLLKTKK